MIIALIQLIFLIIKIVILSAIYSSILLLILFVVFKRKDFVKKLSSHKFKLWLFVHFIISVFLFQYRFTYWRDTGLGENSIIPIGYEQKIENADGEMTFFYPDLKKTENNKDEIYIKDFIIRHDQICAEISNESVKAPNYQFIVYDLKSKNSKTFNNERDYKMYARENDLPGTGEFYAFEKHYYEYINAIPKWKKWLLP